MRRVSSEEGQSKYEYVIVLLLVTLARSGEQVVYPWMTTAKVERLHTV